jgi:hypothetical protein
VTYSEAADLVVTAIDGPRGFPTVKRRKVMTIMTEKGFTETEQLLTIAKYYFDAKICINTASLLQFFL